MPVNVHERKEDMKLRFVSMDRLPDAQRAALLLKTTEGQSMEEIAVMMSISNKAASTWCALVRLVLRMT